MTLKSRDYGRSFFKDFSKTNSMEIRVFSVFFTPSIFTTFDFQGAPGDPRTGSSLEVHVNCNLRSAPKQGLLFLN